MEKKYYSILLYGTIFFGMIGNTSIVSAAEDVRNPLNPEEVIKPVDSVDTVEESTTIESSEESLPYKEEKQEEEPVKQKQNNQNFFQEFELKKMKTNKLFISDDFFNQELEKVSVQPNPTPSTLPPSDLPTVWGESAYLLSGVALFGSKA